MMKREGNELLIYIKSDLYRCGRGVSNGTLAKTYRTNKMFRFTFWFRLAQHYNIHKKKKRVLAFLTKIIYNRLSTKYSIDFPLTVKVGFGLKINHGMALVVNSKSVIGNNVMLTHNVTLASEKNSAPVIGDRVRISPGVVIVGGVLVGDNVVVGANALVNKDVPPNSVAVGVPNKNILKEFKECTDRYYFESV